MKKNSVRSEGTGNTKIDLAYQTIRNKILRNEYAPGSSLTENSLCEELGLSRTPVRSALQRLEYDGLVRHEPGRGMTVSMFTLTDLLELAEIRIPNECIAVGLAVERMTDQEVEELGRCVEETVAAARERDSQRCFELDNQFHMMIARGSKNGWTQMIVKRLLEVSDRSTFMSKVDYDRMPVAAQLHVRVYEAIEARDKELAQQRMQEHLNNWIEYTKNRLLDNFYLYL